MTAELDIEQPAALLAYLRDTGRIEPEEAVAVRPLTGGVSNRTVLVQRPGGEAWVLKQALAKLRVAVDWFSGPERIEREALGLHWLAKLAPPGTIPLLVFTDPRQHLLAMQAVPEPHTNWKMMLLAGDVRAEHVAQFGRLLGTIHTRAAGRADLSQAFADRSFFESLRLEPYYGFTAQQVPAANDFLQPLIEETRAQGLTLVHGDYSPKNILVCHDHLVLLDHEVIHWGDPAFDVGFSLTHLLSKGHHLPVARERFAAAAQQYWQVYRDAFAPVATAIEPRAVRHTLGCLLARVAGRSPLEYLRPEEQRRQREVAVTLMRSPPRTITEVVHDFLAAL